MTRSPLGGLAPSERKYLPEPQPFSPSDCPVRAFVPAMQVACYQASPGCVCRYQSGRSLAECCKTEGDPEPVFGGKELAVD